MAMSWFADAFPVCVFQRKPENICTKQDASLWLEESSHRCTTPMESLWVLVMWWIMSCCPTFSVCLKRTMNNRCCCFRLMRLCPDQFVQTSTNIMYNISVTVFRVWFPADIVSPCVSWRFSHQTGSGETSNRFFLHLSVILWMKCNLVWFVQGGSLGVLPGHLADHLQCSGASPRSHEGLTLLLLLL